MYADGGCLFRRRFEGSVVGVIESNEVDEYRARAYQAEDQLDLVAGIVGDTLAKLAIGVYSEELHGSLREILEEIEGVV